MRARVSAVKRPPALPLVPVPQSLHVRSTEGAKVRHLLRLPHREWGFEQQLARRPDTAQARVHPALGAGPPEDRQRKLRLRARLGHGEDARPVSPAGRERASSERCQGRQPAGEPGAVDTSPSRQVSASAMRSPGHARSSSGTATRTWQTKKAAIRPPSRSPVTSERMFGNVKNRGGEGI